MAGRGHGALVRADTACAAAPADGGVRRRGEAGPEWGKGRVHAVEATAARLTSGLDGGERRRTSGATSRGGGWRTGAAAALQGRGKGWMRAKIGGGRRGEASYAKNRGGTHRRR